MNKFLLSVIIIAIAGVAVTLMSWDIPAPSTKVTKTLSNDRFPS